MKPARILRLIAIRARRNVNAWLAACVIVIALSAALMAVQLNEARADLKVAEERAQRMERAEAMRKMQDARWSERYRSTENGKEYEWRVRRARGDS